MKAEFMHIPYLRFPGYTDSWRLISIQEAIDEKIIIGHLDGNHGELYPRSNEFSDTGVPYITANDFVEGVVSFKNCKYLPGERASKFKKGIAKSGDVLFAHNATVGPTALLIMELDYVILSTTATYFRCDNSTLLNGYLLQALRSPNFIKQYRRVMSQSTRNQVPITTQRKFNLLIPIPPEQQKIATFLSAVDKKNHLLQKKKELLEQYKKGVMQKIFSREIRFKDENGQDYPEWEKKKLGEVTYKVGKKNTEGVSYPIYSINNQEGFLPQSEQFDGLNSSDRGYDISMYKIIHPRTFAYNPARINVGSIGYSYDLDNVIISSLYVCFRTKEVLEDSFLLTYLDTYTFNKDILRYEEGGVRQYLFYENFSQIRIPLPSNREQQHIASFLSSIGTKIENISLRISATKQFKKGLLQQMFV